MNVDIKINNNVVSVKMLTAREYVDLANSKLNGKFKDTVLDVLRNRGLHNLPKHQAEATLLKLIVESTEQSIAVYKTCECSEQLVAEASASQIIVSDTTELKYDFGAIKLQLRYPCIFEDEDLLEMINRCIVTVEIDGNVISWDELSSAEMDQVLEALELSHVRQMVDDLVRPVPYVAIPVKCTCGKTTPVVVAGFANIFEHASE